MNNINNILISKGDLETILNSHLKHPITIDNADNYRMAFIQKSFVASVKKTSNHEDNTCVINLPHYRMDCNERLELRGDRVIELIITDYLLDNFPNATEGFTTKVKIRLTKCSNLAYLAKCIGLEKYILVSCRVEITERILEDTFESFIGVLYLNTGKNLQICREFLLNIIEKYINIQEIINSNDNFVDSLMRYFHSQKWGNPSYITIYTLGGNVVQNREFATVVLLNKNKIDDIHNLSEKTNRYYQIIKNEANEEELYNIQKLLEDNYILGFTKAKTKKSAEQICAKKALSNLKISWNF